MVFGENNLMTGNDLFDKSLIIQIENTKLKPTKKLYRSLITKIKTSSLEKNL